MSLASKALLESGFEPEELYDTMLLMLLILSRNQTMDDIVAEILKTTRGMVTAKSEVI